MYFIAILIMFGLLQYWGSFSAFQKDGWFFLLLEKTGSIIANNWLVYILLVLFPCLFLVAILVFIKGWLWGIASLLLAIAVLVYALGRIEYNQLITDYATMWKLGDYQSLPVVMEKLDPTYEAELGEGLQRTHVKARESYIYAAFEGVFTVLFWFVLLGPAGALLYRLNSFFMHKTQWPISRSIHAILERPAAFLLGLTFALMGDFGKSMPVWQSTATNMGMTSKNVVHANALAATGLDMEWLKSDFSELHPVSGQADLVVAETRLLIQLVRRSLVFAVFTIAIFQIVI